jgi:hypothetical protein
MSPRGYSHTTSLRGGGGADWLVSAVWLGSAAEAARARPFAASAACVSGAQAPSSARAAAPALVVGERTCSAQRRGCPSRRRAAAAPGPGARRCPWAPSPAGRGRGRMARSGRMRAHGAAGGGICRKPAPRPGRGDPGPTAAVHTQGDGGTCDPQKAKYRPRAAHGAETGGPHARHAGRPAARCCARAPPHAHLAAHDLDAQLRGPLLNKRHHHLRQSQDRIEPGAGQGARFGGAEAQIRARGPPAPRMPSPRAGS